jgi:hypothetical protein
MPLHSDLILIILLTAGCHIVGINNSFAKCFVPPIGYLGTLPEICDREGPAQSSNKKLVL